MEQAIVTMRLGVVIVNYNGRHYIEECLRSVAGSTRPPSVVVVVDNASHDSSADLVASSFPHAVLIRNRKNEGFAGGVNAGVRHCLAAGVDAAVLLNPDTAVRPDALEALARGAERHPRSLVGPRLLMYGDPRTVNSYGTEISWWRGRIAGPLDRPGEGSATDKRVGVLSGCCLLLPRSAIEEIGLLDEGYFLYFEDTDLAVRARRLGYRLWIVPDSVVLHREGGATGGPASPVAAYYFTRNRHCFVSKFKRGRPVWFAFLAYSAADVIRRTAWALLRGDLRLARAIWRGAVDGWRGRKGAAHVV